MKQHPSCCEHGCQQRGNGTHVWVNHSPGCQFYKGKPLDTRELGPVRLGPTPLTLAKQRVRAVAEGATINGTYKLLPEAALDAFRADLLRILAA